MKVYFSCSITGGRQDQPLYRDIVTLLEAGGHEVPTAHLAHDDVLDLEAVETPEEIYMRDVDWVRECDALIAEVSTPSHGVGYEIALAVSLGKPVLCCYREGVRVSKMILGNRAPHYQVYSYQTPQQALALVKDFVERHNGWGAKSS